MTNPCKTFVTDCSPSGALVGLLSDGACSFSDTTFGASVMVAVAGSTGSDARSPGDATYSDSVCFCSKLVDTVSLRADYCCSRMTSLDLSTGKSLVCNVSLEDKSAGTSFSLAVVPALSFESSSFSLNARGARDSAALSFRSDGD